MIFTVEEFNKKVNSSGDINNRYKRWSSYRNEIREILHKVFEEKEIKNVLVLGAGGCNDLDLNYLSMNSDKLYLSDIDLEGIYNGIHRQNLEHKNNISFIKCDYTGLDTVKFFEKLYQLLLSQNDITYILDFIKNSIDNINMNEIIKEFRQYFDLIIILPIYTQLAYTQLNTLLNAIDINYIENNDLIAIKEKFLEYMPLIIRRFNELVISLGKENCEFIMLTDLLEDKLENMDNISSNISNNNYLDNIMELYNEKFGYGLGSYGKLHFEEIINIKHSKYMIWPFEKNRNFLVYGCVGSKK